MPRIDVSLDDIPSEHPFRIECDGRALVVVRTNGNVHAFEDRCPHAQWPLSEGDFKDGSLYCIGHGWEFDVKTGRCLTVPVCNLKIIPTYVENGTVRIEWNEDDQT